MSVFDIDKEHYVWTAEWKETTIKKKTKKTPNNKDAHTEIKLVYWYPKHHES